MTIVQIATGITAGLTPTGETTIHAPVTAGGAVVLLNIRDMAATDELLIRHYITFDGDGNTVIGSKIIEHGVTTDDTWSGTAGSADADGWQSWPLGFGDGGGSVTIESLSGTYDIEWIILGIGGATG